MNRSPRLTALLLALGVACSPDPGPSQRSQDGPEPQRVVSLIPSATETIAALGAWDRLVARTDYDTDPRLADLPSVGRGLTPSLEALVGLEPDLVVAWPDNTSRSVIARLADLGVRVYTPAAQNLEDLRRVIRELGSILGRRAAADSLIRHIDASLEGIQWAVRGRARPDVFYVVWYDPPTSVGPGTYIDRLIQIAGGRNVFADAPSLWPQVSLEEVVRRDPDVVIFAQTEESPVALQRLRETPGWREVPAVRDGRLVRVNANLFNRPGPRVIEAAGQLARLLHPGAFPTAEEP